MTRTIDSSLQTHLDGEVTTLALCWKIVRTDNTTYYFTDHDVDLAVDGDTYESAASGDPMAISNKLDLSVDNLDVDVMLDSSKISEDALREGRFDYAEIWVFMVNYEDTTYKIQLLHGTLGEVEIRDYYAKVEFRSLMQQVQQRIGRTYMQLCDCNAFADSRCGLTEATYTTSGTVSAVTDSANFDTTDLTQDSDYYDYGKLTWTSGDNSGLISEVKNYELASDGMGSLELRVPLPNDIQIGDTFDVVAGCDRQFSTCKDKFSNVNNFRGFPHIPGRDETLKYAIH